MANNKTARKVLTIQGEGAIKNLLTLAKRLDSHRVVAASGRVDRSTIRRSQFDSAILDLRYTNTRPSGRGYGFGEVLPNIVGKVLVINAEINDWETFEMVEKFIYRRRSIKGMLLNLAALAQSLVGSRPSPNHI